MKRLIELILFAVASVSVFAEQEAYLPFVEEAKVWVSEARDGRMTLKFEVYEIKGDTIVNGQSCKKMNIQYVDATRYDDVASMCIPVYEENKIVYYFTPGTTNKHILYDFNVLPGDTLSLGGYTGDVLDHEQQYIIDAKGRMEVCGRSYVSVSASHAVGPFSKRNSDTDEAYESPFNWIERIGSLQSPFFKVPYTSQMGGRIYRLLECRAGNEVLYDKYSEIIQIPEFDINNDYSINVADVAMLYGFIVGKTENIFIYESIKRYYDLNLDGEINMADVSKLYDVIINGMQDIYDY